MRAATPRSPPSLMPVLDLRPTPPLMRRRKPQFPMPLLTTRNKTLLHFSSPLMRRRTPVLMRPLMLQGSTNTVGDQKTGFDFVSLDELKLVSTASSVFILTPATTVPRQRWFCIELMIKVVPAGGDGFIEEFLDGASLFKSPIGVNTLPPGGWMGVSVGVNHSQGLGQDQEIFYDDFVLSQSRLGCQ